MPCLFKGNANHRSTISADPSGFSNLLRSFSISAEAPKRKDVKDMAYWLEGQLKQYGVTTQLTPLGTQELDGQTIELPPAILGSIGNDPKKKTVLVYGHFDVQPVSLNFSFHCCNIFLTQYNLTRLAKAMDGTLNRSNCTSITRQRECMDEVLQMTRGRFSAG